RDTHTARHHLRKEEVKARGPERENAASQQQRERKLASHLYICVAIEKFTSSSMTCRLGSISDSNQHIIPVSVDRNADQLEPTRFENYSLADAANKKRIDLI
ncbi:hypothetical protein AVEN_124158-1, partial [Araneus ventricosus]